MSKRRVHTIHESCTPLANSYSLFVGGVCRPQQEYDGVGGEPQVTCDIDIDVDIVINIS